MAPREFHPFGDGVPLPAQPSRPREAMDECRRWLLASDDIDGRYANVANHATLAAWINDVYPGGLEAFLTERGYL